MVRVVFFGSDSFSLPVLEALLASPDVQIAGVVTQPDRPAGRGRRLRANVVKERAASAEVPVLQPSRVRQRGAEEVADLNPDLLVVASYGQILPGAMLALGRRSPLNLHPSLLPLLRGPTPIGSAILEGLDRTGVSLMVMTERMDAGPIVAQVGVELTGRETEGELRAELAEVAAGLVVEKIGAYMSGAVEPRTQDEGAATYTRLWSTEDAVLDWHLSAETLSRQVRAYNPWPGARSYWGDRAVRFLRAHPAAGHGTPGAVVSVRGGELMVGTGGGLLAVTELQMPGGKPLPVDVVLRGRPELRGAVFGVSS